MNPTDPASPAPPGAGLPEGKRVIITGGAGGIGRPTARLFAAGDFSHRHGAENSQ